MVSINCKGTLIDFDSPKVMGILNVTPDSFYDGGSYKNEKDILAQAEKMLNDGATFIDVGAYSSRPDAEDIRVEEECNRLIPVVELLLKNFPEVLLSIDTFRSKVAQEAVTAGAALINDISAGLLDPEMLPTVAKLQVPYILMHMRGTPQTMKGLTDYDDLVKEVLFYLSERVAAARALGLNDIIVDPGLGFAKTITQNYELLNATEKLQILDLPILIGLSRKSMITKTLGIDAASALNGTTALNMVALQKGASILRVHDVKEAVETVSLYQALKAESL
ncbi:MULTISPECIES: dihydropteroate synthase [Leeuwenhoekiella]|jgi:dihydropteroate synthase|uniref:Dihydropteroate synthase n=1 Tax=Leeuwenhoekiella blandensis (strain CECT 7118 / CCUG 51940 / KCTC 22103 / MED217) TaxID=398720 RepID=A3XJL9_LEEBM|nr:MULTISPECIES: dihydropteroate synthase [Leeuwenhoekiella]EAQ50256.1 putative dihydropteroate synthase [Leeuwenhoekiella blandensis MED217]MAO43597.1 dihydropteroate synthase [Leeuwenhoekiella sp.]HBT09641.1 dihydropteroate synthase [Leeuwenhoekiella sp.]HCW65520.1 dihydropteroate synthase [Leeuwenhoekiella sp.]|tara:strand:+ start:1807 stop:2643 length:837 start_codon:yes stop_codon:yes gene_type:complete